ncbi:hypothetical protein MCEMRE26_00105 [Candidatus Nanopelagicaceae bacterium]
MTSKSKKFLAILISLTFALFSLPNALAANVANGKCPSAGKVTAIAGAKYICTKSGKKLIWKKSTSKPAASTASQSDAMAQLESIFNALKPKLDKATQQYDLTIKRDPLLANSQWTDDSVASIGTATKLLQVLGVAPSKKIQIYLSFGPEFADPNLPEYCRGGSQGGGYCGQTGILFSNIKSFLNGWGYGDIEKPYKSEMDKFISIGNVPHELGHYGQDATATDANNSDYWMYAPGWYREGGAEYFKFLAYAYDNKVTYKHLHDLYLSGGAERCVGYPLLEMSKEGSNSNGCEYTKGLFAIEYLVLKTGNPSTIFAMNKTVGGDTASIFKKTYGFTLEEFSKEADAYFARVIAAYKK